MNSRILSVMWVAAAVIEFARLPLIGNMTGLDVAARGIMWLALMTTTIWLARLLSGRWAQVLLPGVGILVIVLIYNWSLLSPRAWFYTHRPLYDLARSSEPGEGFYGRSLPFYLRPLTATGESSGDPRFFPQWIGIPDDAGGYIWSPEGSPDGEDMYGMICSGAVDLGDGWWMCGMVDR